MLDEECKCFASTKDHRSIFCNKTGLCYPKLHKVHTPPCRDSKRQNCDAQINENYGK